MKKTGNKIKRKYVCSKCNSQSCVYRNGKALCPKEATSVLCRIELLNNNDRLACVATNGCNAYYHVVQTNTVIFNVENMYCIILDYEVESALDNKKLCLPRTLSTCRFRMQNMHGRDWCKKGNVTIGEIIHRLVYGDQMIEMLKQSGDQEDHQAETYNEKICNTQYCDNPVEASHRVCVEIKNQDELNQFLDDLIDADENDEGIYYNKGQKQRTKKGRKFVYFK